MARSYRLMMLFLFVDLLLSFSCSSKDEHPGNSLLVFDYSGETTVDGQDLTVTALKIWKSTSNADSPGVLTIIEKYLVELWFKLSGEGKSRYALITGLIADTDGFLYLADNSPGTIKYKDSSERLAKDGAFSFTASNENGLVEYEYPAVLRWDDQVGPNTTTEILQAHKLTSSGWDLIRERSLGSGEFASRVRYLENTGLSTKGKLGCIAKAADASAALATRTLHFADVEVGVTYQDKDGRATSGETDKLGDDDALLIRWAESWHLAGVNAVTHKLRFFRARRAPIYNARELPGVDSSDTTPKISGVESLLRQCNTTAAKTGGYFHLLYLTSNESTPERVSLVKNSTKLNFCQTMATQIAANANTVPLQNSDCSWTISEVVDGTWNGTAHTSTVTTATEAMYHLEHSEIKEVQF